MVSFVNHNYMYNIGSSGVLLAFVWHSTEKVYKGGLKASKLRRPPQSVCQRRGTIDLILCCLMLWQKNIWRSSFGARPWPLWQQVKSLTDIYLTGKIKKRKEEFALDFQCQYLSFLLSIKKIDNNT